MEGLYIPMAMRIEDFSVHIGVSMTHNEICMQIIAST